MSDITKRFAHLIGLGGGSAAALNTAAPAAKAPKAEMDDEDKKDEDKKDDEKDAKAAKAEADDDKKDEDKKDDEKDAKAAKAEDGDDDSDDEDMKDKGKKAVRLRERGRCAAILSHPAASKNLGLAVSLAFGSRMSRNEAIILLENSAPAAAPAPAAAAKRRTLDERMAGIPQPNVSAGAPAAAAGVSEASALAKSITNAGRAARGLAPIA